MKTIALLVALLASSAAGTLGFLVGRGVRDFAAPAQDAPPPATTGWVNIGPPVQSLMPLVDHWTLPPQQPCPIYECEPMGDGALRCEVPK